MAKTWTRRGCSQFLALFSVCVGIGRCTECGEDEEEEEEEDGDVALQGTLNGDALVRRGVQYSLSRVLTSDA